MTAEIHNLWKSYLYKLQIQAPKPKPILCSNEVSHAPSYYGSEFHGSIARTNADILLKDGGEGSYLVRESQRLPGTFTLCLRYGGCNKNYKLFYDGKRHYVGEKRLSSLDSLVADGLITMHVEAKARQYLENMAEQAIYENSPYITLRGKQRNLTPCAPLEINSISMHCAIESPAPSGDVQCCKPHSPAPTVKVEKASPNLRRSKAPPNNGSRRFSVPTLLEESPVLFTKPLSNMNRFSKCLTRIQHQANLSFNPTSNRNSIVIHPKSCLMPRKGYGPQEGLFAPLSSPKFRIKNGYSQGTTQRKEPDPAGLGPQNLNRENGDIDETPPFGIVGPTTICVAENSNGFPGIEHIPNAHQTNITAPPCVVMRKKRAPMALNPNPSMSVSKSGSLGESIYLPNQAPVVDTELPRALINNARRSARVLGLTHIGSTTSLSSTAYYPNAFSSLKYGHHVQSRPGGDRLLMPPASMPRPSQNPPLPPIPLSEVDENTFGDKKVGPKFCMGEEGLPATIEKPLIYVNVKETFRGSTTHVINSKPTGPLYNIWSKPNEAQGGIYAHTTLKPSSRLSAVVLTSTYKGPSKEFNPGHKARPPIPFFPKGNPELYPKLTTSTYPTSLKANADLMAAGVAKLEKCKLTDRVNSHKVVGVANGGSGGSSEGSSSLRSRASNRNSPVSQILNNTCDSGYHNEIVNYEKPHVFKVHTFKGMHWCDFCGNFMWGLVAQGVRCRDCGLGVHKRCSLRIPPDCTPDAHKWLKCRVFGVDLTCHLKSLNLGEPLVLTICTKLIESSGIDSEGIYRVPGYAEDIETLRQYFDSGIISHDTECIQFKDINVVAGVLKLYFRLLPLPLITFDSYQHFLDALKLELLEEQIASLKRATSLLPLPHYNTLKRLMGHLKRVSEHQKLNLMSASNLAMVFAPNLLRSLDTYSDQCKQMQESFSIIKFEGAVIEILIKFQHLIFAPSPQ